METTVLLLTAVLLLSAAAQTKITAEVGQDVILPCEVHNKNIKAVKWIRPDQDPEYVLFYRDGHFDPDYQNPSYQNRVDLQDKDMKDGDVSMILKNVKMEDNGRYECRVFEKGKNELISIINLKVRLSGQKIIEAEVGQDVILPCKVLNKDDDIKAVEWIRPDQEEEYVLLYRGGHFDPDNQHPSYQNRVDLQDKDMKDGDVSLILKNVTKNDTGRYECRVFQRGSNRIKRSVLKTDLISIIFLKVHLSGEKFEGGKGRIIRDEGNQIGGDISRGRPGAVVTFLLVSLVVLASLGFLMYKRHMKKNLNLPVPHDEPTAEQIP